MLDGSMNNTEKAKILAKKHSELLDIMITIDDLSHSHESEKKWIMDDLRSVIENIADWTVHELQSA